ncbi:MAG: NTP transferase domain-containing protein [Pseudomonadota bacterium]
MITVAAVLAAGKSTRFGSEDKLLADFKGNSLASYAARAVSDLSVTRRIVAYRNPQILQLFDGFDQIEVTGTQSDSLKACVRYAKGLSADRLLVTLADTPRVDASVLSALLSHPPDQVVASQAVKGATVPACLPAACFDELLTLEGDVGARSVLNTPGTLLVSVDLEKLIDIDTKEMLAQHSS